MSGGMSSEVSRNSLLEYKLISTKLRVSKPKAKQNKAKQKTKVQCPRTAEVENER